MNWLNIENREFDGKKWEGMGWEFFAEIRVKNQNHACTIHRNTTNAFIPLGNNIQFSTNTEKEQVIIKKNL
jgi:hypothetical protein